MSFSARRKKIRIIACQTKSFTLVEVLLSVGILVVLVSMVVVGLGAYKGRTAFDLDANQIVALLRNAQSRAVSQDRGQGWGVQFTNSGTTGSQYALFWGTSYVTSSVVVAGTLGYSSVFTDPAPGFSKTIVFNPVTGAAVGPDVVVIKNSTSNNVAIITVSALGLIGQTTESGLAGYWPMDEGGGTSTYDASGNNNVGALTNGPVWIAGKTGWALSLDGVNDSVNAGNSATLGMPNNITVAFWVNAPVNSGYQRMISKNNQSSQGWEIQNSPNSANVAVRIDTSSSTNQLFYIYNVINSTWHHVAFVISGASVARYVDGVLQSSSAYAVGGGVGNSTNLIIGGDFTGGSCFNEKIDDVRVYNRALSATEIKNLFSAY